MNCSSVKPFLFSSSSVASHILRMCPLCTYSKFGHHPQPLGYLSAKFSFCPVPPHCCASPRKKSHTQITQSLTHPAYLIRLEPKHSLRNDTHRQTDRRMYTEHSSSSTTSVRHDLEIDTVSQKQQVNSTLVLVLLLHRHRRRLTDRPRHAEWIDDAVWFSFWFIFLVLVFQLFFSFSFVLVLQYFFVLILVLPVIFWF